MPIPMTALLAPPKDWEEFEHLCADLFQREWSAENLTRHGVLGERQFGVDIYATRADGTFAGIQCKGRRKWPPRSLGSAAVQEAAAEAISFAPKLDTLIIATIGEVTGEAQAEARAITERHRPQGLFGVEVRGWTELLRRLADHESLLEKYYGFTGLSSLRAELRSLRSEIELFGSRQSHSQPAAARRRDTAGGAPAVIFSSRLPALAASLSGQSDDSRAFAQSCVGRLRAVLKEIGVPSAGVVALASIAQEFLAAIEDAQYEAALTLHDAFTTVDTAHPSGRDELLPAAMGIAKCSCYAALSRTEEEIAAYTGFATRYAGQEDPGRRFPALLAECLARKGDALARLDRASESQQAYRQVVEKFVSSQVTEVRRQVARALLGSAKLEWMQRRFKKAIGTIDLLTEVIDVTDDIDTCVSVARGLICKATALALKGSDAKAIGVCDELLRRFILVSDVELQEEVVNALVWKGYSLCSLEREAEAAGVFFDLYNRIDKGFDPGNSVSCAAGQIRLGCILHSWGAFDLAGHVFDRVISQAISSEDAEVQLQAGYAFINKALTLREQGKVEQAIEMLSRLFGQPEPDEPNVAPKLLGAGLLLFGTLLRQVGRLPEAVAVFDRLISLSGGPTHPIRSYVASALFHKALALNDLQLVDQAIVTYRDLLRGFGKERDPEVMKASVHGRANLAQHLKDRGELEEALEVYAPLASLPKSILRGEHRAIIARMLINRSVMLCRASRFTEALAGVEFILAGLSDLHDEDLDSPVARAWVVRVYASRRAKGYVVALALAESLVRFYQSTDNVVLRGEIAQCVLTYIEELQAFRESTLVREFLAGLESMRQVT